MLAVNLRHTSAPSDGTNIKASGKSPRSHGSEPEVSAARGKGKIMPTHKLNRGSRLTFCVNRQCFLFRTQSMQQELGEM